MMKTKINGNPNSLVTIPLSKPLHEKGDAAIRALQRRNDPPLLFVRSGQITRLRVDEKGRPHIERAGEDYLAHRLSVVARFIRNSNDRNGTSAPKGILREVLARDMWPFPALEGVVQLPIVRPDGTICYSSGYDPTTRLYYCPPKDSESEPLPSAPHLKTS